MNPIEIEIDRLRIYAYHGVMPQERQVGNEFEVTVRLSYPADRAVESDRLEGTLNYAEAIRVIEQVMAEPSELLEHVAGRIQKALTERFPAIAGGSIKVAKMNPPVGARIASVAVTLTW